MKSSQMSCPVCFTFVKTVSRQAQRLRNLNCLFVNVGPGIIVYYGYPSRKVRPTLAIENDVDQKSAISCGNDPVRERYSAGTKFSGSDILPERYSLGTIFSGNDILWERYSLGTIFSGNDILWERYSPGNDILRGTIFSGNDILRERYSLGTIFSGNDILRERYSPGAIFSGCPILCGLIAKGGMNNGS
jgi:hypothetical protein